MRTRFGVLRKQWFWFLIALSAILRWMVAFSYLRPTHPDEYFQVIELSQMLSQGTATSVMEQIYHLRNLSVAYLIWGLHAVLGAIGLLSPYMKLVGPRLLMATLDLVVLCAAYRRLRQDDEQRHWIYAVVIGSMGLVSFSLRDAPSLTLEHSSMVMMWFAVLFYTYRSKAWALFLLGTALALVPVLRYPSALFSVGFIVAMLMRARLDAALSWKRLAVIFLPGLIAGFGIGGLADLAGYGRFYESAWMYLQFNVFSGLASQWYGSESLLVYFKMFVSRFVNEWLLLIIPGLPYLGRRLWRDIKSFDPMLFACLLYIVGHFFPAHKELRFMIPMSSFVLWYVLRAACDAAADFKSWKGMLPKFLTKRVLLILLLALFVLPNVLRSFVIVRGDVRGQRMGYFSIAGSKWPDDVCAAMMTINLPSFAFPSDGRLVAVQELPRYARISEEDIKEAAWNKDPEACKKPGQNILVAHEFLEDSLRTNYCTAFRNSVYAAMIEGFTGATTVWKCSIDARFLGPERVKIREGLRALKELPPFGLKGNDLVKFVEGG